MFSWGQRRDGESRWRRQLIPSQLHEPVSSARLSFEPPVDAVASCVCTAATHAAPTCVSRRTAGGGSASGGLILHTQSKQSAQPCWKKLECFCCSSNCLRLRSCVRGPSDIWRPRQRPTQSRTADITFAETRSQLWLQASENTVFGCNTSYSGTRKVFSTK